MASRGEISGNKIGLINVLTRTLSLVFPQCKNPRIQFDVKKKKRKGKKKRNMTKECQKFGG